MAAHYLIGSDWNATGSWDDADVPDAGEDVVLGADSPAYTTGPSGANQDVKVGTIRVLKGYRYDFCSSGAPHIGSAAKIIFEHPGNAYFQADAGGAANATNKVIVRAPGFNASQVIQLGKAADPGAIEYITVTRGNATIVDATGILKVLVDHVSNPTGDAVLTINSAAGTVAFIDAQAGKVNCSTTVTAAHVAAAEWNHLLGTITSLYAGSTGVVNFDAAGTIALARIARQATLDLTRTDKAKTITDLLLTGRSIFKKFPGTDLHVVTNTDFDQREAA